MEPSILCGVVTFANGLDPRLIADRLLRFDTEFVAVYKNAGGETIALFSLASMTEQEMSASRFVDELRSDFGPRLIQSSVGRSVSRTINIPG